MLSKNAVEKCCRKMLSFSVERCRILSNAVDWWRKMLANFVEKKCRKMLSKNVVEKNCRKKILSKEKKLCCRRKKIGVEICRPLHRSYRLSTFIDNCRIYILQFSTSFDNFRVRKMLSKNVVEFCCRNLGAKNAVEFCWLLSDFVEICRPLHRSYCRLVSNVECCRILLCRIMGLRVAEWGLSNGVEWCLTMSDLVSDFVVFRYGFIVFRYIFVE